MGKIVVLADNNAYAIKAKYGLGNVNGWINGLINELYLTAQIISLPEVRLPEFEDFESPTDKLTKTLTYEWATARVEAELLLGDPIGNWASLGETALKNSNGYRYRKHRLLDLITDNPAFQLQENYKLGIKILNVGFGDITDRDKISITGSWIQEFIAIQYQPPYVVNNLYGGGGSTPTTPTTSNATLSLLISGGASSASIFESSAIAVSLSKANANKTLTGTWRKDGTLTTLTCELITDANGSASVNYSASNFANFSTGKYKLEITDGSTIITSNEINVTNPTVSITPNSIYNWVNSSFTVSVSGVSIGQTYTLEILNISGTAALRTQTTETLTANFTGAIFAQPGTYKARITKGTQYIESNELTVSSYPQITLTTAQNNIAYIAADNQVTYSAQNLKPNTQFTYTWVKDGVDTAASATLSTDANGAWIGSFVASVLANPPWGEGILKIKLVQGDIVITSNNLEVRNLKFEQQPLQGANIVSSVSIPFNIVGIPVGAKFGYSIYKNGILIQTFQDITFAYTGTSITYHQLQLSSTALMNAGAGNGSYAIEISYNGKTLRSNSFNLSTSSWNTEG